MTHVNKVAAVGHREGYRPNEDDAIITMAFRGMADNFPDDWQDMGEQEQVDGNTKIQTFLEDSAPFISTKIRWHETRWYAIDPTTGKLTLENVIPMGDFPGSSGAQALPPQIALSITFKTAKRKNWGRFYVPSLTTTCLQADGGFDTGALGGFADRAAQLTARDDGTSSCFTVWSPTDRTHHDPQEVQVDDIPDVIRSRRFSAALHKEIRAAG